MSKKLQGDSKTSITSLPPATHLPIMLSEQIEASRNIVRSFPNPVSHAQALQSQIAVPVYVSFQECLTAGREHDLVTLSIFTTVIHVQVYGSHNVEYSF